VKSLKSINEQIKNEAYHLGFALCGIIHPIKPSFFQNYLDWIESGCGDGLEYLTKPSSIYARSDPKNIFPDCRSIIIVAYPYTFNIANDHPFRVAGYAHGQDYHLVVKEKLHELVGFIQGAVKKSLICKICCDTSALMEKYLAYQAGFGWIGKNGLLINPTWGSGLLLGEILMDIELIDESIQIEDQCNDCQDCIQACPSQCITPNRTIQANLCNSFQSIENKGEIALEQCFALKNWVFGCDICQIVCPFNCHNINTHEDETLDYFEFFHALESGEWLFKNVYTPEFERQISETALQRIQKEGLIRNFLIVIGTQKLNKYLPFLDNIIDSYPNARIQKLANWSKDQLL